MTQTEQRENKMGIMPVPRLLFSMALPMMASMLVQALYNVVDSIFVARLSEDALTAVSIAFPMQNLMIGVATGIGVGMNAMLSRKLGEKDYETANQAALHGIFLIVIAYVLFLIIGLTVVTPFLKGQLGSESANVSPEHLQAILEGGRSYLTIICVFSFGLFGQITLERLLQSTGKTIYSMITQMIGAIINIILDPILIFGLLGVPKLGVAGAAIATVFGQIVAACVAIWFNVTKNKEISLKLKNFRPDPAMFSAILYVGVPSIIMMAIGSVMTYSMNRILMKFTSTAAAVFGAYFKLQSFIMMPVFGLNNGMVPIIAYNYGARKKDRLMETIRLGIVTAVVIMIAGMIMLQVFPVRLLGMFSASEDMIRIGVPALRTISLSYIFAGFCIICVSTFQAFGRGFLSMIVSIFRQLVVLIPAAWLLSLAGDVNLIWWAYPMAELMSLIVCCIFLRKIYREIICRL